MDHRDHADLLRAGVPPGGGTWADLGSGSGAFTLALAELLGPAGRIVSVDRDEGALRAQAASLEARLPEVSVRQVAADFRRPLELPTLDGLVMANSLHFVARPDQPLLVRSLARHLRPGGRFLVVEYDTDVGNPWVPHPFSYRTWEALAADAGLVEVRRIGRIPSRWLGAIYSAAAEVPDGRGGSDRPQQPAATVRPAG